MLETTAATATAAPLPRVVAPELSAAGPSAGPSATIGDAAVVDDLGGLDTSLSLDGGAAFGAMAGAAFLAASGDLAGLVALDAFGDSAGAWWAAALRAATARM